jgi:hypothetical protein
MHSPHGRPNYVPNVDPEGRRQRVTEFARAHGQHVADCSWAHEPKWRPRPLFETCSKPAAKHHSVLHRSLG